MGVTGADDTGAASVGVPSAATRAASAEGTGTAGVEVGSVTARTGDAAGETESRRDGGGNGTLSNYNRQTYKSKVLQEPKNARTPGHIPIAPRVEAKGCLRAPAPLSSLTVAVAPAAVFAAAVAVAAAVAGLVEVAAPEAQITTVAATQQSGAPAWRRRNEPAETGRDSPPPSPSVLRAPLARGFWVSALPKKPGPRHHQYRHCRRHRRRPQSQTHCPPSSLAPLAPAAAHRASARACYRSAEPRRPSWPDSVGCWVRVCCRCATIRAALRPVWSWYLPPC